MYLTEEVHAVRTSAGLAVRSGPADSVVVTVVSNGEGGEDFVSENDAGAELSVLMMMQIRKRKKNKKRQ
jgi:hypothetical protein